MPAFSCYSIKFSQEMNISNVDSINGSPTIKIAHSFEWVGNSKYRITGRKNHYNPASHSSFHFFVPSKIFLSFKCMWCECKRDCEHFCPLIKWSMFVYKCVHLLQFKSLNTKSFGVNCREKRKIWEKMLANSNKDKTEFIWCSCKVLILSLNHLLLL